MMEPLCLYCNLPEPKHLGPRQWCPKGQANIENRALKAFLPAHNLSLVSLLDNAMRSLRIPEFHSGSINTLEQLGAPRNLDENR